MAKRIVLLSGKVSAGKSTLCEGLVQRFGAHHLKTKELIAEVAREDSRLGRGELQRVGDLLDRRTEGEWVARALTRFVESLPGDAVIVVDAVRIIEQVHAIRRAYGSKVFHIHLEADIEDLTRRYRQKQRHKNSGEFASYGELSTNKTERRVGRLAQSADAVIKTDRCTKSDVVVRTPGTKSTKTLNRTHITNYLPELGVAVLAC